MLPFARSFRRLWRNQPTAQISILCRGKTISREQLFTYTNGHFLIDEDHQYSRRYRKLNLDALCDIAARAGGSISRITAIEKLEGGFSKALLMKRENGSKLIAKVPCHIAGPAYLTTTSEVGTLEYIMRYISVKNYTTIPVPRVFSWSSDASNPVGAEYIVMEKAAGVPLFERWGKMAQIEKMELIKNLTQLEAQLAAISFPAYGGLYLRADAEHFKHQYIHGSVDEQHLLCIGPSPGRSFDIDDASMYYGPWDSLSDLGTSIAKRELSRIGRQNLDNQSMAHRGSPQEQACLLEIVSLSVLPLFLQTRWPVFLQPPRDYTRGLVQPVFPDDFDSFDKDDKATALHDWTQAKLAKAYEVSTFLENRIAHNAMNVPRVFRELFIRTGETSDVGVVPLRECLIEIFKNWSDLGFSGHCPYSFSQEDIRAHEEQFADYKNGTRYSSSPRSL
ncbi:predicted protein [Aspergillus terreus NIH2624]|uniref:Aminoglycoside phosphotransferase domain-containing protein n=1 Tax=Aspergillus terreus (strain NIH 2624 / FGSC A1156) TaxID=341663 RepID=Q0D0C4_ASPTN|nr:uncharacterized protein ATEG_00610 [Aspergillus terreus NIH2624]EAU39256.1 predicted protein [Aspergillus terreus NIH2624]